MILPLLINYIRKFFLPVKFHRLIKNARLRKTRDERNTRVTTLIYVQLTLYTSATSINVSLCNGSSRVKLIKFTAPAQGRVITFLQRRLTPTVGSLRLEVKVFFPVKAFKILKVFIVYYILYDLSSIW